MTHGGDGDVIPSGDVGCNDGANSDSREVGNNHHLGSCNKNNNTSNDVLRNVGCTC